jgi:hypothetical protein
MKNNNNNIGNIYKIINKKKERENQDRGVLVIQTDERRAGRPIGPSSSSLGKDADTVTTTAGPLRQREISLLLRVPPRSTI